MHLAATKSLDTEDLVDVLATDEVEGVSWPAHSLSACQSDSCIVNVDSDPQESPTVICYADH